MQCDWHANLIKDFRQVCSASSGLPPELRYNLVGKIDWDDGDNRGGIHDINLLRTRIVYQWQHTIKHTTWDDQHSHVVQHCDRSQDNELLVSIDQDFGRHTDIYPYQFIVDQQKMRALGNWLEVNDLHYPKDYTLSFDMGSDVSLNIHLKCDKHLAALTKILFHQ